MTKSKEYTTEVVDQFKYVAWVAAPELWITPYGILSNNGMRDHYLAAIIHEAPVLARGAMFEGPLLLDAHR
jgi:hypothetical protein